MRFSSITPTSNRGASKAIGRQLARQTLPAQPITSPRAARALPCATSITNSASATVQPPQRMEPSVYNYHYRTWGILPTIRIILLAQQHSVSGCSQPAASAASIRTPQSTAPNSIRHHPPTRLTASPALMGHIRIDHMRQYVTAEHHAVTGGRPRQASERIQDIAEGTNNI